MFKKILVGTDGSDTAGKAVGHAAELAKAMGAELVVLTAYAPPHSDVGSTFGRADAYPGQEIGGDPARCREASRQRDQDRSVVREAIPRKDRST